MNTRSRCLAAAVAVLCCCACSPTQLVGSRYVKSEKVTASQGATLTVTADESPELAGTQLVIPPGALEADTQITLELGLEPLTAGADKPAGEVVHWGPSGTRFLAPVTMTLPYRLPQGATAEQLFVQVEEEDGARFVVDRTRLVVDEAGRSLRFDVEGFTGFQPGANAPCMSNNDCAMGQVCVNGVCKQPACGPNAPCPTGQTCVANGTCTPLQNGCGPMNLTCAPGELCVNGTCQACQQGACGACTSSSDCPMGQACVNGQCQQTMIQCGPNAPCPMGEVCTALGQCVTSSACGPAGCPMGQQCVNGVCQGGNGGADAGMGVPCGGAICPVGYSCVNQQCQAPAMDAGTPAQCGGVVCQANQLCLNNQCQTVQCTAFQGCPPGSTCVMGVCQ